MSGVFVVSTNFNNKHLRIFKDCDRAHVFLQIPNNQHFPSKHCMINDWNIKYKSSRYPTWVRFRLIQNQFENSGSQRDESEDNYLRHKLSPSYPYSTKRSVPTLDSHTEWPLFTPSSYIQEQNQTSPEKILSNNDSVLASNIIYLMFSSTTHVTTGWTSLKQSTSLLMLEAKWKSSSSMYLTNLVLISSLGATSSTKHVESNQPRRRIVKLNYGNIFPIIRDAVNLSNTKCLIPRAQM